MRSHPLASAARDLAPVQGARRARRACPPWLVALAAIALALGPAPRPRSAGAAATPAPADSGAAAALADTLARDTLALRLVPLQVVGGPGGGGAGLAEPSGVTADAFGRLYVTDAAQHRLVRYDARGAWLGESGALGSDLGDLRRPVGVTTVGTLGVAVLDRENRRIVQYDLFGRLVGVQADLAALEDEIGRVDPLALAADRGGALYVADADRDRVLLLDFSGRYVRALGGFGTGPGSFRGLAGLACGPRGELFSTERAGARVQRLGAGGEPLGDWPLAVSSGRGALAIAVDDSARVAVADEAGGRLWVFDRAGTLLGACAGLAGPRALAFAPDGTLLVAESAAARVRRFALEPTGTTPPAGR
jgi:DNA-binding beta-propeller fold protein YncE